jgi:hypothetical protein
VVIVNVVVTVCASGVTGLLLKLQLENAGSPAQLKLIGLVYEPSGVIVNVKVAVWPGVIVADVGLAVTVKSAAFTVSDTARDVLPASSVSPPYTAVIECEPTVSEVVVNVAVPEPFSVPVPSVVVPSLKVTVPVGVPETSALTTAVNVTDPPENAGFMLDVTAVVVFCSATIDSVKTADVLVELFASPP